MNDNAKTRGQRRLRLKIHGMHCANCEILIERRFKKIAGVRHVTVRHTSGIAEIVHYDDLDIDTLRASIADDGYTISSWSEHTKTPDNNNTSRDYFEIGAAFLILVGLFLVLRELDIVPDRLAIPSTIGYGLAFAIGVVASLSTCMAVTGGLLVAVAAKYNEASGSLSGFQKFKPHLYFNIGRIVSYTLLGGAIGGLGSTLALSAEANGILVIAASAIMILLGLQMLRLLPWFKLVQPPKFIAHWIHDYTENKAKRGAFLLGAATFFLPCGFTQGLQLYVLAKGSFVTGALIMLAFSLGTLPALLSLSALSSFARGGFQRYFLKFAGAAVVLLGLFNIQSGFTLTSLSSVNSAARVDDGRSAKPDINRTASTSEKAVPVVDGKQIVDMKVVGYTYEPNRFAVVQGIPVEWRIDAQQAAGCGRILIAPKAGVRKLLPFGTTVISFTPQETGDIAFNCSMGMMTRGSKITVLASAAGAPTAQAPASSAPAAAGQTLSPAQRGEIEQITREYLLQHPEVLKEVIAALEARQQAAEAEAHQAAIKDNAATLFNSPRQVVLGNPQGDTSLVEFFDYNCGYCRRALGDTISLLRNDPKLRIVLKEFPVLGESSVEAAKVAVAVRMQDPTGEKYFAFHQKLLGGRGQANWASALAAAREAGADMARLERDAASPEATATINENLKLAEALGLSGTPSYVVGSDVIVGAVGLEALREKVRTARK